MSGHVFDHGAGRQLPLSRRAAASLLVVLALGGATLWVGFGASVRAALSPVDRSRALHGATPRTLVEAAATGNEDLVAALLADGIGPDARDVAGCSALSAAIRAGETGVARRLLAAGAKLSGKHRAAAGELHLAADHDDAELIRLLLEAGASIDDPALELGGATALHIACENGRVHSVDALLHAGADHSARDASGFTPLARAALLSQSAVVQLLFEHGVDLGLEDARGRTALQLAAAAGDLDCVRILLQAQADPNLVDDHGWTALHEAGAHGRTAVVLALTPVIDHRTLNARTSRGATALHLAVRHGGLECVRALLEGQADSSIRDADGRLPRDLAPQGGSDEPWNLLGAATPTLVAPRPNPVLLDGVERRPCICLCSHPARVSRGPSIRLELAIWADGATVFTPWSPDGSRAPVAGVVPPSAVQGVLLDLEEIGWLDSKAPAVDRQELDCVELGIDRHGTWTRVIWEEVEHLEGRADALGRAALVDWSLGRERACDVLRAARPATTQDLSFVEVRGSFRGLSVQNGAQASWMPRANR